MVPKVGLPVLDLHGAADTTVPANVSLSADGYYYTTTHEIFHGTAQSPGGWMRANGCKGEATHWPTKWDGKDDFYCIREGECEGGDVVRCMVRSRAAALLLMALSSVPASLPSHARRLVSLTLSLTHSLCRPLPPALSPRSGMVATTGSSTTHAPTAGWSPSSSLGLPRRRTPASGTPRARRWVSVPRWRT